MFISDLFEDVADDIAALQPNTPLTVYHGSDAKVIKEFVLHGIDARTPTHRLYPHYVGKDRQMVNRGLFVGAHLPDAAHFGRVVVQFTVLAKDLFNIFPTQRHDDDRFWRDEYPNSFRPGVSAYLAGRAWKNEPQALFRGLVSPAAIEKVYGYGDWYQKHFPERPLIETGHGGFIEMTPQEFVGATEGGDRQPRPIEPQERITPEDYIKRLCAHYGCKEDLLLSVLRDFLGRAKSYDEQIAVIRSPGGGGVGPKEVGQVSYTAGRRLAPLLLAHLGIPKAPSPKGEAQRWH